MSAFFCAGVSGILYLRIVSYLKKHDPQKWNELQPKSDLGRLIDSNAYYSFLKGKHQPKTDSQEILRLIKMAKTFGILTSVLLGFYLILLFYDLATSHFK